MIESCCCFPQPLLLFPSAPVVVSLSPCCFPQPLLSEYAGFFFIPLVSRLTSDESAKCRKLTALAVKCLLGKVGGRGGEGEGWKVGG